MEGLVKKLLDFMMIGVPRGHLPVTVGLDARVSVLVMEARHLNHPLLKKLLKLSVEEFGYTYRGALRIACDVDLFLFLLKVLNSRDSLRHNLELEDLFTKFSARQLTISCQGP
ncbi:unnamed protein product [Victoria cruziana]